jgi:glycogen operon protein
MLLAGDEQGNSQQGNNNAYCQDNPLGWIDWRDDEYSHALQRFCRRLIDIRRQSSVFYCSAYIHTDDLLAPQALAWFDARGEAMSRVHWAEGHCRSLQMLLKGENDNGQPEMLLLLLHAGDDQHAFTIPKTSLAARWQPLLSSATADGAPQDSTPRKPGQQQLLISHSLLLFKAIISTTH